MVRQAFGKISVDIAMDSDLAMAMALYMKDVKKTSRVSIDRIVVGILTQWLVQKGYYEYYGDTDLSKELKELRKRIKLKEGDK